MINPSKKILWPFLMLFLAANSVFAQAYRSKIVAGNKLYTEEKYDESLNKYRDAQVQAPESPIIKFNIGDAQYKKKNFEEALKEFESSLTSDDVLMQAKTYYNVGNSLYRQGKLPESIQAYTKSLKLNPDDEDAKYNLEFVRTQLKDQAQKQQQNQQQNDQKQQEQDKKEQEKQSQQAQQEQEQQQQQASKEDISKEDAKRILDALKEDEQQKKNARKQQLPGNPYVTKDW